MADVKRFECSVKKNTIEDLYSLDISIRSQSEDSQCLHFLKFGVQVMVCEADDGSKETILLNPCPEFTWVKNDNVLSVSNYLKDVFSFFVKCAFEYGDVKEKINKLNDLLPLFFAAAQIRPPTISLEEYTQFEEYLKSVQPVLSEAKKKLLGHFTVSVGSFEIDSCFLKRRANLQSSNNPLLSMSMSVLEPLEFLMCIACLKSDLPVSASELDDARLVDLITEKQVTLVLVDGNNRVGKLEPHQKVSIMLYQPLTVEEKTALSKANSGSLQISEELDPWSDIVWKQLRFLQAMKKSPMADAEESVGQKLEAHFTSEYGNKTGKCLSEASQYAFRSPAAVLEALRYVLACETMSKEPLNPIKLNRLWRAGSTEKAVGMAFKMATKVLTENLEVDTALIYRVWRYYDSTSSEVLLAEYVKMFFVKQELGLPPALFHNYPNLSYKDMTAALLTKNLKSSKLSAGNHGNKPTKFNAKFIELARDLDKCSAVDFMVHQLCFKNEPDRNNCFDAADTYLTSYYNQLLKYFEGTSSVVPNSNPSVSMSETKSSTDVQFIRTQPDRTGKGRQCYTSGGFTSAKRRKVGGGGNKNPAIKNSSSLTESKMPVSETGIGAVVVDTAAASSSGISVDVIGVEPGIGVVMNLKQTDTAAASSSGMVVDAIGIKPGIGVAIFPVDESGAQISGSTSQTSKCVHVDSWQTETEPDFQVFMSYVDSASFTFNDEVTLLEEDYCTMRELFPACVEQFNEGRWWRMDLVQTFMSTICNSIDTFYFDWEERQFKKPEFKDRLEKLTGHFKVYITVNIGETHWVLLEFEGTRRLKTMSVSLFDSLACVTNEHQKVQEVLIFFADAIGYKFDVPKIVWKEKVQKDKWSCGTWVVRAAFQQGGMDDVHEEDSIQEFREKCKANIVTWFSQWMQSLHAGVIYSFPQLVSKDSTTHVVEMMVKIVIPPKKVLVSGTFYKDSSFTFKLELGMLHGNLILFLESQSKHANRVIMGPNIAEFESIYTKQ